MLTIKKSYAFLTSNERLKGLALLFLMFIGAWLESVGIGLFMPFVALINDPKIIHTSRHLSPIYEAAGRPGETRFLVGVCLALVAVFIVKTLYLGKLTFVQNRYLSNRYVRISRTLLQNYLEMPYELHLTRNQSEFTQRVMSSTTVVVKGVYAPCLTLLSEAFVLVILTGLLVFTNPVAVLSVGFGLGGFSFLLYRAVRSKVRSLGEQRMAGLLEASKWVFQSFGSIKEVKILGRERFFADEFSRHNARFSDADAASTSVSQLPRLFIETAATVGLALFVISILLAGNDPRSAIPVLALFAMAAFRMIPSINRIVASAISIRQSHAEVGALYDDYSMAFRRPSDLATASAGAIRGLERDIEFRDASYRYPSGKGPSLERVSIRIPRGQSVAFVGPSGAGKTTMVDVMMGLLPLTGGQILVDGKDIRSDLRGWQSRIGYIPQAIYLCDDTIRGNVAFGLEKARIDENQVWAALKMAQLDAFVRDLPDGLDTRVGDRGVRLSGGQRQRIGIARALYPNPEVLLLDEATSALDNDTESAVIHAIESLRGGKTIIVIAHRLSTVARCDQLYFMKNGNVVAKGTFDELRSSNGDFRKFASL